ncbi:MAG: hypothetical protein FJ308_05825 [Planctomycetes bacterium]|nr:hypothetical protein [Planctomycetota bacterium]
MSESHQLSDGKSLAIAITEASVAWDKRPVERISVATQEDNAETFYFAAQQWKYGGLWLVQGFASLAIAVYFIAQIPGVPRVTNQLLICDAFMSGLGVFGLWKAVQSLISNLRVSETGIPYQCCFTTHRIRWDELQNWVVRTKTEQGIHLPSVEFEVKGLPRRLEVPRGSLSNRDLVVLQSLLKEKSIKYHQA